MKKIFITFFALCGIAAASDYTKLESHAITLGDSTTTTISAGSAKMWLDGRGSDINFENGWMMEFSIGAVTLSPESSQVIFVAQGSSGGLEITVKGDNSIALTDRGGSTSVSGALTLHTDVVYRAAYDKAGETVYLTNTQTGEYATGFWNKDLGGYANIGTYAARFQTGDQVSISVFSGYDMDGITGEPFKAYATASSIPEPAAAALSMLALAGFAGRRRRK